LLVSRGAARQPTDYFIHPLRGLPHIEYSPRSAESHVILAKAGIQLILAEWTPACAGVTKVPLSFL